MILHPVDFQSCIESKKPRSEGTRKNFGGGWSWDGYGSIKSTTHMPAREPSETSENRIYS